MPDSTNVRPGAWKRKLATAWRMPWADRVLVVEAGGLLAVLRLALRCWQLQHVQGTLARLSPRAAIGAGPPQVTARARRVARLVDMAARNSPVTNTCLHRSLTLWWLLRRRRLPAALKYGARRRDGRLEAHAWVECGDAVLNDVPTAAADYVPWTWASGESDA